MRKPKYRRCQAFAKSSNAQCTKNSLKGSKYCFWHQTWGTNVFGAVIMLILGSICQPIFADFYYKYFPSQEYSELKKLGVKVDEIYASQGNTKAKEDFLAAYRILAKNFVDEIVQEPDDELILEQRANLSRIERLSADQANKLEIKWGPAVDFILTLFDNEIEKWNKKGIISKIESKNIPVIIAEKYIPKTNIRDYHFVDGSRLVIIQESGRVLTGEFYKEFSIQVRFLRPSYYRKIMFYIKLDSEKMNFETVLDNKDIHFEPFTVPIPFMLEEKFLDYMPVVIQQTINYAIVHSGVNFK